MSGDEDDLVRRVADGLRRLGIGYMIVGSYASNVHGRPRDSFDADIVVDVRPEHVLDLCREFENEFVMLRESVEESIRRRQMFNLIPKSGIFKIDLIPLRDDPYAREEFRRRAQIPVFGTILDFARPEDVILSKLRWFRKGGEVSGRQLEDARDVVAAQGERLDREYLRRWASVLQVDDLLGRILKDSGPVNT